MKRLSIGTSGSPYADRQENINVIRRAIDDGFTMIDTADFYGNGMSEMIVGEAVKGISRDRFQIVDKYGSLLTPTGQYYGLDMNPLHTKSYLSYSLKRLGVDYIDVYMPCRIDQAIPVEETVGAVADCIKEGYVKEIALSQVDSETLRRAEQVHHISYVELDYSLMHREFEDDVIKVARELGIKVISFGALAHGFLSGLWTKEKHAQCFLFSTLKSPENIDHNLQLIENLRAIANEKGITIPQLAVAWVLAQGEDFHCTVGATKMHHYIDTMKAADINLTPEDLAAIEQAMPKGSVRGVSFPDMKFKNGLPVITTSTK